MGTARNVFAKGVGTGGGIMGGKLSIPPPLRLLKANTFSEEIKDSNYY
jgi:hypothetical protein